MTDRVERDLTQIGLNAKEASVYRAVLELGSSTVQHIAQRARVPRATTYLALASLKEKGLVTTFEKGKRTCFVAESPDHLAELVTAAAEEIRAREDVLKRLVPKLKATGQFAGGRRPGIRFYEGPASIRAFLRENLKRGPKEILTIYSHDDAEVLLARAGLTWDDLVARRKRAGIRRRVLYTWRKVKPPPGRVRESALYLPYSEFPCTADLTVVGDRVALVPYDEPTRAVAIEDAAIAAALRAVFNALWSKLRKKPLRALPR